MKNGLLVEEKQIVVPGEELAEGIDYLPAQGATREGTKIIACQLGMVTLNGRLLRIIPLSGRYIPKFGDIVIGRITNVGLSHWNVDVGYAYDAMLSVRDATSDFIERGADLTKYYDFGDMIMVKITKVSRNKNIDLTMKGPGLRKLKGGKIIHVTPSKVPRVIGKQGSMISMIKERTGCRIFVGQNGVVWIQGENVEDEIKATEAIMRIEEKAHTEGLTDEISKFLGEPKVQKEKAEEKK